MEQSINVSAKFWDRLANNFDNVEGQYHQLHIKIVENAKKYLRASGLILDYGCATGTAAIEIADQIKAVHGVGLQSLSDTSDLGIRENSPSSLHGLKHA